MSSQSGRSGLISRSNTMYGEWRGEGVNSGSGYGEGGVGGKVNNKSDAVVPNSICALIR